MPSPTDPDSYPYSAPIMTSPMMGIALATAIAPPLPAASPAAPVAILDADFAAPCSAISTAPFSAAVAAPFSATVAAPFSAAVAAPLIPNFPAIHPAADSNRLGPSFPPPPIPPFLRISLSVLLVTCIS